MLQCEISLANVFQWNIIDQVKNDADDITRGVCVFLTCDAELQFDSDTMKRDAFFSKLSKAAFLI